MAKKFSIYPKIALALLLGALLFGNLQVADSDLNQFGTEQAFQPNCADVSPIPVAHAQAPSDTAVVTGDPDIDFPSEGGGGLWGFVRKYWGELATALLVFLEAVFRLTPSKTDNSIVSFIKYILDRIIPNARAGGGKHE